MRILICHTTKEHDNKLELDTENGCHYHNNIRCSWPKKFDYPMPERGTPISHIIRVTKDQHVLISQSVFDKIEQLSKQYPSMNAVLEDIYHTVEMKGQK